MASNYDIISATSDDVGNLSIPVSWNIENPETDLTVFVLRNGSLLKWDGWNYNSNTGVIAVIGIGEQFSAFVFRTEQAAILASLVSTNEVRVGDIIEQLKKDNRVLEQLQVIEKVALRTCDEILPIANSAARAGKVLAFGEDGNPDLSLSKEDVEGAYLARDEAKELKNETETLKNQTAELKSDAESYKNYAAQSAAKALAAQGKAEEAQVAAEKAKTDTGNLKSDVEATVSGFNSTVNAKVQEVESAAQSGIEAVNSAKTAAVGEISTIKTEVETAGANAVSEVNAAKADANTEIAAAKDSAINDIDAKGASYQEQISANSAVLTGAVWTSDVSASLGQILPRKHTAYGYDAWNYTVISRSSAKYTVLGYYMPRSGGFSLFYESNDETGYASGACLKVEEDRKTVAYYNAYDSGNNSYSYETLDSPLVFGDCLAYVFDCGNVKVYRNKELLFERQIEDESYLSGNLTHFSNLLGGDNYKKSFLLSVGNAFPLEDEFYYSISDFVSGVVPPAGYLANLSRVNAPFADATGLQLSQVTGTYSQSFSGETSCAKFVPSGLSSTSKKVRYFNFKSPYANEKNATCKVRMKFYLPTSNANWKYIGFNPVGAYAKWKETSNLLDANNCISAKDEWQTLELTLKNGNGTFAPRFYFRPDSGTTTTSAAIGQAIASAASNVFYLAEYVVEYPPAIDNYVETPTQNGIFLQKGTIPYNMMFGLGMYSSSYCDINNLGDRGANNARSVAASQVLTSYPYLYADSFDFIPYGRYCLSSITLKFADLSALADTDTITVPAIDSSYRDTTFTKAEVRNGQITIHCYNPNSYDLRSNEFYWNFSMYASSGVQLSGDIIFNWERVN